VPAASYTKYLVDLMKTGDGKVQNGHSEADMVAAASFWHNLSISCKLSL